ncbi:MAG: ATP-binding protein [Thermodesulfobacteriota bacterium]
MGSKTDNQSPGNDLCPKQLFQAIEQSSDPVVLTDTSAIIIYVNSAFVRTTGYQREEAIGKTPAILKSGLTHDSLYRSMWETIARGNEWSGEFINKKKNGEIYEEHTKIAPIRNEEGTITHYMATRETITDLKRACRQAEIANETKNKFLANMSHEIRSPIKLISAMAEQLFESKLEPGQFRFLSSIQNAADHLLLLINDILDYSSIESEILNLDKQPLDLAKLFDQLHDTLDFSAAKKGLLFNCILEGDTELLPICDRQRLHQVLTNLVGNSIKFTDNGKVEIKAVICGLTEDSCSVSFSVRDTGIGITPDQQQTLLDGFSRVDTSTTSQYGGTGLGLAISRKLIQLMGGGDLQVKSSPGLGSLFSFTLNLPTEPLTEESPQPQPPTGTAAHHPLNILLVEDNEGNQELAKLILEQDNHKVTIAENGLEALETLSRSYFEVVLMDIQMPVMDGLQTTSLIRDFETSQRACLSEAPDLEDGLRSNLYRRHTHIIAMTAHAMAGDREQCMAAGTDDYIAKPYNKKQIRATLACFSNRSTPDEPESPPVQETIPASLVSTENVLEHLKKKFDIRAQKADTILDTFIRAMSGNLTDLSGAVKDNDSEMINAQAHKIKGSLSTLGLHDQAELAQKLEHSDQTAEKDWVEELLGRLSSELKPLLNSLTTNLS